jgi:sporulation protein YlmC with PRC-barrel domain
MAPQGRAQLVKLGDADLTVADPNEDVRGRKVVDRDGKDVGTIHDLFIDSDEKKVRFLQVGSGGFLGLGEKKVLIPVDAITRITDDEVQFDQTHEHVARTPPYDPDLMNDDAYTGGVYGHYGYQPYWTGGYIYPLFPYYTTSLDRPAEDPNLYPR